MLVGAALGAGPGLVIGVRLAQAVLAVVALEGWGRELARDLRRQGYGSTRDVLDHDEAVSDELVRTRLEAIGRLAERHGYTPVDYLELIRPGGPAT